MNTSKILHTIAIVSLFPISCFGQIIDSNQKSIQVTGESHAFLENKLQVIKFNIEVNASNATQADKLLLQESTKITKPQGTTLLSIKKQYQSATSDPNKLVKGSPFKAIQSYIFTIDEEASGAVIDNLLNLSSVKISEVSSRLFSKTDSLKEAHAKALENAKAKASFLAKSNSIELGDIIEINNTEEPTPSSIREQLNTNPDQLDSGTDEVKVFSVVRFAIKQKQ